jgi:hypothetical protein
MILGFNNDSHVEYRGTAALGSASDVAVRVFLPQRPDQPAGSRRPLRDRLSGFPHVGHWDPFAIGGHDRHHIFVCPEKTCRVASIGVIVCSLFDPHRFPLVTLSVAFGICSDFSCASSDELY